jgi:hypothetical protein
MFRTHQLVAFLMQVFPVASERHYLGAKEIGIDVKQMVHLACEISFV